MAKKDTLNSKPITAAGDGPTAAPAAEAARQPATGQLPTLGLSDEQVSEEAHGDDEPPLANVPPATAPAVRGQQGDEGRPYCPRHNVLMRAIGSHPDHTRYKCPVPGCDEKAKRVRPTLKVPHQPQMCPQRSCDEVAMVVTPALSNVAQFHMECPQCGFSLKVPRPTFAPQLDRQRRIAAAEDLAAR